MTTKLAITAVFLFAVVLGVGAIAPAMAAKADAPGQNKVPLCHFDEEENQYVLINIPPHAAEKHKDRHANDVDPDDANSCPDINPPVITLLGDNPLNLSVGDAYVEPGATAIDDVDGDISGSIVIDSSAVDTTTPGSYEVTYDVSDSAGNAATQVIRTVIVS